MRLSGLPQIAQRAGKALWNRTFHGKPRGVMSIASYAASSPSCWHVAIQATIPARRPPRRFGSVTALFDLPNAAHPALGVVDVAHGSVDGASGWTFTKEGWWLADASWYGTSGEAKLPWAFSPVRVLKGRCLNLVTDFAHGNYGHFVLDGLARFGLVEKAGIDMRDIDFIYMPKPVSRTARIIMLDLGIPEEKCIWAQRGEVIRADHVLATSFPGRRREYADWIPQFLQRALPKGNPQLHRIYVPREGVRRAVNENELMDIAAQFGFQPFDFRACEHEPSFFHAAQAVIGAHGAGLTNLAFCQPSTRVLELIPSDHVYPYYYTLSDSASLDYSYLIGESAQTRAPGAWGPSPHDFHVDPVVFREALRQLFD
jgi:capsular polysaccharide biosynthesis protein